MRHITVTTGTTMKMTIPMKTMNPRTPGLMSKGYAGLLLPDTRPSTLI
jgi:hypothetical protein